MSRVDLFVNVNNKSASLPENNPAIEHRPLRGRLLNLCLEIIGSGEKDRSYENSVYG